MDRREYLTLAGLSGSVVVTGCLGGANDSDGGGTDQDTTDEPSQQTEQTDEDEESQTEKVPQPPLFDANAFEFSGEGARTTAAVEPAEGLSLFSFDFETVPEDGANRLSMVVEERPEDRFDIIETTVQSGLTARALPPIEYLVDVETPGAWTVEMGQPSAPEESIAEPPFTASGSGVDVVGPVRIEDGATVSLNQRKGEHGIWVNALAESDATDSERDAVYLITSEPPFEGERETDKTGTVYFEVLGAEGRGEPIPDPGEWTIKVE